MLGSKAPEGQNIGNKQQKTPYLAPEGRNFAVFLDLLTHCAPLGLRILRR
jgi:hypothetical protein